ncbi:unnamed protein product [Paramecium octaurelia]|uniref:Uncharacterized protein n=1 Tax=Paramecium octaurelia TaxID=43137 RepID=A0A8S1VXD9_PAROT|nr:unnamed protein product [Paramecium octaurelia]
MEFGKKEKNNQMRKQNIVLSIVVMEIQKLNNSLRHIFGQKSYQIICKKDLCKKRGSQQKRRKIVEGIEIKDVI